MLIFALFLFWGLFMAFWAFLGRTWMDLCTSVIIDTHAIVWQNDFLLGKESYYYC